MDSLQNPDQNWRQNWADILYWPIKDFESNPTRSLLRVLGLIFLLPLWLIFLLLVFAVMLSGLLVVFLPRSFFRYILCCKRRKERSPPIAIEGIEISQNPDQNWRQYWADILYWPIKDFESNPTRSLLRVLGLIFLLPLWLIFLSLVFAEMLSGLLVVFLPRSFIRYILCCKRRKERSPPIAIEGIEISQNPNQNSRQNWADILYWPIKDFESNATRFLLRVLGLIFLLPLWLIFLLLVFAVMLSCLLVVFMPWSFIRYILCCKRRKERSPPIAIEGIEISQNPDQNSRQNWADILYWPIKDFESNPTRSLLRVLGLIFLLPLWLFFLLFVFAVMLSGLLVVFLPWNFIRYILCCKRRKERSPPSAIEGVEISPPSSIEGVEISPTFAIEPAPDDFNGDYLKNLIGLPTIFSFQALETATGSFSKEIGRGGFGKVYEGTLTDGTQVAVKCLLNETGHGQREFCAEIATLSSLNHSNLVSLRGVCVEGPHRILVYEFMPNGSLDRWLFSSDKKLDWKTRYSIALDTARGIAYLHDESRLGILHLDVKPQNILLDEDFKAKVSDFGMARTLKRDLESRVVTGVRGTPGYMAPEWFMGWGITYKTDVFSYGMMLLEIIRGGKNVDNSQDSENWYFPSIAFKKARQGKMDELIESGLKLKRPEEIDEAYRLIKTALWCIQSNSGLRPSMGTVVRLLEGDLELLDPPLACTLPFAPSLDEETHPDLVL